MINLAFESERMAILKGKFIGNEHRRGQGSAQVPLVPGCRPSAAPETEERLLALGRAGTAALGRQNPPYLVGSQIV